MTENIDINETEVLKQYPEVLEMLLKDHATQQNIYWATDSYADRGEGYQFKDAITVDRITGDNGMIIRPRSVKSKDEQTKRSKDMAEVFTPSWVCNAQNNLIDDAWFGKKGVFNSESPDHTWKATSGKIEFPDGKTWKDYVRDTRLEITCGAPPLPRKSLRYSKWYAYRTDRTNRSVGQKTQSSKREHRNNWRFP